MSRRVVSTRRRLRLAHNPASRMSLVTSASFDLCNRLAAGLDQLHFLLFGFSWVNFLDLCHAHPFPKFARVYLSFGDSIKSGESQSLFSAIHAALQQQELLPEKHIVDAGYVDAALLVASQTEYAIDLVGPTAKGRTARDRAVSASGHRAANEGASCTARAKMELGRALSRKREIALAGHPMISGLELAFCPREASPQPV